MIWANLLLLADDNWSDVGAYENKPHLRFHEPLWNDPLVKMAASGVNTVVIELGVGVIFESHPERLSGFLQTPWKPIMEPYRQWHLEAIDRIREAREWFQKMA